MASRLGKDGKGGRRRTRAGDLYDSSFRTGISRDLSEKISKDQSDHGDGKRSGAESARHERAQSRQIHRRPIYIGKYNSTDCLSPRKNSRTHQTLVALT